MRKKVKSYNARLSFFPLTIFTVFLIYSSLSAATAKSLQSCPTLCNPRDGSPPGSPVPGILQARTLEWVATSFSNAWKWNVKVKSLSRVWLLATPWTAAYLAPLSMGFSRQEYWSGVPSPSPSSLSSHKQLWKCLLFPPLPLKFIFSFPHPLTVSFPLFISLLLSYPSIFSFSLALWLKVTICFWTFAGKCHQHIAYLSLNLICNSHEFSCHPFNHKLLYAPNIQYL